MQRAEVKKMLDLKHVELKYTKAELLYGLVTVVGCHGSPKNKVRGTQYTLQDFMQEMRKNDEIVQVDVSNLVPYQEPP